MEKKHFKPHISLFFINIKPDFNIILSCVSAYILLYQTGYIRRHEFDSSILCEMQSKEGYIKSKKDNDEEWTTRNSRHMSKLWD